MGFQTIGTTKKHVKTIKNYNSFLSRATGILSCSLYFVMVRLAMLNPLFFKISFNTSSERGFCLFSSFTIFVNIFFISLVETSSPS